VTDLYLKTGAELLWSTRKIFNGQDLLTERFDVSLQQEKINSIPRIQKQKPKHRIKQKWTASYFSNCA